MIRHARWQWIAGALVCLLPTARVPADVSIQWTSVGNPGNGADATGYGSVGAVDYAYHISKYEVTNSQYAAFLNAKAADDPLRLYSAPMGNNVRGGITRSGEAGGYSYAPKPGYADMPVVWESWFNAIRFVNWLNNGQGNGDTESGAYTLLGGSETPSNNTSITRSADARIVLPTYDEWHKAAYHQPAAQGGDVDEYWAYPTATNDQPHSDQPPGDPSIRRNAANFQQDDGLANGYDDGFAVTGSPSLISTQNYVTDVGAYTQSPSYYGTLDQGGNVTEWTETLIFVESRVAAGGSWLDDWFSLRSGGFIDAPPGTRTLNVGFRVAMVPEPTSALLCTSILAVRLRRRR